VAHDEIAGGLAADATRVANGDVGAHPLENPEQSRAPRVQVDAVHVQLGVLHERRRDDERSGGGEVARNIEVAELETLGWPDGHSVRASEDVRPSHLKQRLRVVARRHPLDDRRLAIAGKKPGEQDRGLHLR